MDSSLVRVRRPSPKPLLLKDHLLDDMSSCSSNGFRSFPRRSPQCCTAAVRFLNPPSRSSPLSALRSAVAAAARRFPFAAAKSTGNRKSSRKSSSLARSLSRKLLERGGFWKRKREWKPLEQLMKEDSESSSSTGCWGSDFADGNSSAEVNLDSPEGKMVIGVENDGAGNGVVSAEHQKQWSGDQEKEQFSPVSVLDCPFHDEDDELSPVFKHRLARVEGTKIELMKKIQRFECLAKLEPVNLATQFALQSDDSDNESSDSTLPRSSYSLDSLDEKSISDIEEGVDGEKEAEHTALELLRQVRANCSPSYQADLNLKEHKLLLDFFREGITNKLASSDKQRGLSSFDKGLLDEAEDWISGQEPREVFAKWEVQKYRQAYVDDMEKRGEWRTLDQEREAVALELENEVFVELMNELLLEISN